MKEFIQELENNIKIKDTYTVRIDYVLERLTDIKNDIDKYLNDRLDFLNGAIDHFIDTNEEEALKYMYARQEIQGFKKLIEEGSKNENS